MVKNKNISNHTQKVAANIIIPFLFAKSTDEVYELCQKVIEEYQLMSDPFTGLPCCAQEWAKNNLEYDKQTMMNLYGHCDGLE